MDWPLIGCTALASWFVLLLANDVAALAKLPRRHLALAHNLAFVATLGGAVAFGVTLAGEHRASPCPVRVHR